MKLPKLTPARRRAIYLVATAVIPLLIGYGLLDAERAPLWVALVAAFLVPGMAAVHTDPSTPTGEPGVEYDARQLAEFETETIGGKHDATYHPRHDAGPTTNGDPWLP